ncbi:MAG: exodeoxyribonuclease V subunit gamma [Lachnospiraceae bacterium]|nr:exodeoxyribonuclease V subunit gamma [Lachnospiraceae bacterium]
MALKCWLGNAGSGKSHQVYEEVIREAGMHKDRTYLVIVPEQFTLQTQHDLVNLHPDGGILNIDVLSFARLSYRVFEEVGFAKAPGLLIDDMGKNLILRHLASEMEDDLKVIGKNLKRLGYITEVKSVISEFMQYGVDAQAIQRLQEISIKNNRRILSDKLEDIATLYQAFRNYCAEKYTTTEELLVTVSSVLSDSEKLSRSVIVLDGFTGFTPVQYDLIRALLKKCIDVHVTVLIDTRRGLDIPYDEQELFYLSRKTIRELKQIAKEDNIAILPDHVIHDEIPVRYRIGSAAFSKMPAAENMPKMLVHLEQNLFRENAIKFNSENKISDDIQILYAANPLEEMSYVAVMIERLIREEHYRYKDIAVVTGDMDTYMHAATRVFSRYNIPCFVDKKQPVLQNPFIEMLRAIMRILTEDYSHEGMFSYLKSSMVDITAEETDLLENYCIACGIRGKSRWNKKFIRCPKSIPREKLPEIDALRERIIAPFKALDGAKTVLDHCSALYEMLSAMHAQQQLADRKEEFLDQGLEIKAKEYDLVYPAVIALLDKLAELLGDEEMDAAAFSELLDAGFSELRVGAIPNKTDYVQIGDLTRSRFRDIKALFFVGVNEGVIPQSASTGGLLSDLDREFFTENCADVALAPSVRMQAYTQRLYLYMVMTKPTERLYLSYAGVSSAGSSMMPSYLIGELMSMFPRIGTASYESLSPVEKVFTDETAFTELASTMQGLIRSLTYDCGQPGKADLIEPINNGSNLNAENADQTQNSTTVCTAKEKAAYDDALKLFKYFAQNTQFSSRLESMINSAFFDTDTRLTDSVGSIIAHVIYGKSIQGSVTRLEMYARCAYEHFLNYGLELKEREEFSFEARDVGSVFHGALEVFSGLLQEQGLSWQDLSDGDMDRLVDEAVGRIIVDYDAVYASFRTSYMTQRIGRIMKKTVRVLRKQILAGDFVPSSFELDFSNRRDLSSIHFKLSDDTEMRFAGRIDRLDLLEDDRHVYVKVIDYKSGQQRFDLAAIYRGEQLQLIVYLNAAMEIEKHKHPDKEVLPAGILYYHLDDPLIDTEAGLSDDELQNEIMKKLKLTGLVSSDEEIYKKMDRDMTTTSNIIPVRLTKTGIDANSGTATGEEFRLISNYVNHTIRSMGQKMMEGDISARPGNCDFCAFASVCGRSRMKGETEHKPDRDTILSNMRNAISDEG